LADAWQYAYTDFGGGGGRSPKPVLRAVVAVATPGSLTLFSAIIDSGGPITVVAREVLAAGGDPVERGDTMMLRLGGTTSEVSLFDVTLEVRPPARSTRGRVTRLRLFFDPRLFRPGRAWSCGWVSLHHR
jgi:hypothetical protein